MLVPFLTVTTVDEMTTHPGRGGCTNEGNKIYEALVLKNEIF